MKKYQDLFIDFDDTLYDTKGNAILALAELFSDLHLERYFERIEDFTMPYWKTNVELWDQYAHGLIERDYLMVERFRRPLSCGFEGDGRKFSPTREFCLEVSDHFLGLCACKPGVVEGAHELVMALKERGYRMHICSNGFHEVQYKKLRSSGLFEYFNTIILSEDAGVNKPDRRFFEYALNITGAQRNSTLMIGDNFSTDIIGAKGAGLDVLFFNRKPETFNVPESANYEVHSLNEIAALLP